MDLGCHLTFPTEIILTIQHLDLVIQSVNSEKNVYFIELMVPFEENIDWTHQHRMLKYKNLWNVFETALQPKYFLLISDVKVLLPIRSLHTNRKKKIPLPHCDMKPTNSGSTIKIWGCVDEVLARKAYLASEISSEDFFNTVADFVVCLEGNYYRAVCSVDC